jgi:zinc protease
MIAKITSTLAFLFLFTVIFSQEYKYETVPNDPTGTRIYTLKNGLKVYLSVNKDAPRVQTFITVKTGSKNDPADVTGLAHYLEHMVFKGTSKIGTLDWEKEKVLLKEISDLYEQHKAEPDEAKKKKIYHKIDSVSGLASKYVVANEYDKMISGLGAKGTNAFTSLERTSYINDIPATELEKWMMVESERFGELVLRLFHTELEAVYEEFNIGQDNDGRKSYQKMNELLYPTHPYGTQTTIGKGEHLKNPSMEKIYAYFNQYYVANNMAVCLAGDFEFEATIKLIDKYFGKLKSGTVNAPKMPIEKPQTEVKSADVFGPTEESLSIAFRTGGYHTEDALMIDLLGMVLYNGEAGLMDLNLIQKQTVLSAGAYGGANYDYGQFMLYGQPKSGQTLEEVRDLLLAEVENVKNGDFTDELLKAIIKNNKKDQLSQLESNWLRASNMSDAFIMDANWKDYVTYYDRMSKITKQQLIDWTKKNIRKDNYCIVYKRTGEDKNVYKVDKPEITPIELNRTDKSKFLADFEKVESLRLNPEFVDYAKELQQKELMKDVPFYYITNKTNDLFSLFIELDEDIREDKKISLAVTYLQYLGTDKYTAEELKKKFYSMGVSYGVNSSYIYLNGLNESFNEALELLEHVISNCKADEETLKNLIDDIRKDRSDAKLNKNLIMYAGLRNYAMYGSENKFNSVLKNEELDKITGAELTTLIHDLTSYKHSVMYYGKDDINKSYSSLKKLHKLPKELKKYTGKKEFKQLETTENLVYFVEYDMVQTQLMMLSKGKNLDISLFPESSMFNSYFGSGLSSIVFQEIRESKALAYGANASFTTPNKKDEAHYVSAFIGTQANKLPQAVEAMMELMNNMPKAELQFNQSKIAALKKIESERVIKTGIYWSYKNAERLGINYDIRKDVYSELSKMTIDDLEKFFNENIKGRKYTYCVIGKKSELDMEALGKLGTIKELTLEEVFGY